MNLRRHALVLGVLMVFWSTGAAAAGIDATEILTRSDTIRFPPGDHTTQATVTFIKPGRPVEVGIYNVLAKGRDNTIIQTLAPASIHGTSYLMIGRDLWVFVPDAAMPVRVSFQQRLFGDVANADLARPNLVGDYTPKIDKVTKDYYLLDLTAKNEEVPYARILLAVQKGTYRPLRSLFFGASGKLLKTAAYDTYRDFGGVSRPTRMIIDNPLVKGQQSIIVFSKLKTDELPQKYFTKDYLKKWKY